MPGEWCEESSMFMSQFCEDSLTMQVLEVLDSGECGVVLYDDKAKNVAEDLVFKGLGRGRESSFFLNENIMLSDSCI